MRFADYPHRVSVAHLIPNEITMADYLDFRSYLEDLATKIAGLGKYSMVPFRTQHAILFCEENDAMLFMLSLKR